MDTKLQTLPGRRGQCCQSPSRGVAHLPSGGGPWQSLAVPGSLGSRCAVQVCAMLAHNELMQCLLESLAQRRGFSQSSSTFAALY